MGKLAFPNIGRTVSAAEYAFYFDRQQGRCAVCGAEPAARKGGRLQVDHCHETGVVRGLLCGLCNKGLGVFRDDVEFLRSAIAYLQKEHEEFRSLSFGRGGRQRVRTHCPNGHEYLPETTIVVRGWRQCYICKKEYEQRRYARKVGREVGPSASQVNATKTHCPQGHPYDAENTRFVKTPSGGTGRVCKACKSEQKRKKYAEWRAENPATRGKGAHEREKTHCPHGHEYSEENTYRRPADGSRVCKQCRLEQERLRRLNADV